VLVRAVGCWRLAGGVSLLGLPFLIVLCGCSLGVLAGVWLAWNRWPRRLGVPGRAVSLVAVMVVGVVLAGALVNRSFGFYVSVSDLLGDPVRAYEPPSSFGVPAGRARLTVLTPNWQRRAEVAAGNDQGTVLEVVLGGARSRITRRALLYVPAAYTAGRSDIALPVVELFHGYPGGPPNLTYQLHLASVLDQEIAALRMPPVLAVVPTTYQGHSSECVDAVNGEPDETYLAVDVPADVQSAFRVLPGRAFGAVGYSEGGFCALNLGLHHPDRFAAAASISGYATAGADPATLRLYRGSRVARNRNSPVWWVRHRAPTSPALFLFASGQDSFAVGQDQALTAAARRYAPKLPVTATLLPSGGHNFRTWAAALPAALDFLGRHLPMPLAPPNQLPPAPR